MGRGCGEQNILFQNLFLVFFWFSLCDSRRVKLFHIKYVNRNDTVLYIFQGFQRNIRRILEKTYFFLTSICPSTVKSFINFLTAIPHVDSIILSLDQFIFIYTEPHWKKNTRFSLYLNILISPERIKYHKTGDYLIKLCQISFPLFQQNYFPRYAFSLTRVSSSVGMIFYKESLENRRKCIID